MEQSENERTHSHQRERGREKRKREPRGIIPNLNCVPNEHFKIFGNWTVISPGKKKVRQSSTVSTVAYKIYSSHRGAAVVPCLALAFKFHQGVFIPVLESKLI